MLDHLRRRVIAAFAGTHAVTLATFGPADLQASTVPCEPHDLSLFVLVPRASDQFFNLENNPRVVATADHWEVRGVARIVPKTELTPGLNLGRAPEASWSALVEVIPQRVQLNPAGRNEQPETIDVT